MNRFVGSTGKVRWLASAAACLALTALVGCGGSSNGKGTITGKVTYNHTPVGGGTLTLYSASGSPYPVGIKPDGTFDVSDVPVGQMGVAIDSGSAGVPAPAGSTGLPASAPHVAIPPRYKDPRTSGFTWEIKAGQNSKDFELTD